MDHEPLTTPSKAIDSWNDPALSLSDKRVIDGQSDLFERALRSGNSPQIEDYLSACTGQVQRQALFSELVALEIEHCLRANGEPNRDDYLRRFSEHAAVIDQLLTQLKQTKSDECSRTPAACADVTLGMGNFQLSANPSEPGTPPACLINHPRYQLVRFLGKGGMGLVYLAEHRVMDRPVALKVIGSEIVSDSASRERFQREIKAAARLQHPNIVTAFDAEQIGETTVFVMEFVSGQNLADRVLQRGPLAVGQACDFVCQAALGLQHAYEFGMVHRDLKPHNLMVTASGQVKILDFGLARFTTEVSEETRSGILLGSIDYMAPEQAADSHSADIRADIYSLGCTFYFLLSGTAPFATGSMLARLKAHSELVPPRLTGLPQGLSAVIAKMLAKDPASRYQKPCEVAAALRPFRANSSISTVAKQRTSWTSNWGLSRRRWTALVMASAVAALVALILFWESIWLTTNNSTQIPQRAQDLYQQAAKQLSDRQEGTTRDAIRRLKEAIQLAPDYLEAQIALANAYNLQGDYGWEMPNTVFPLAQEYANKALQLDSNSAAAHLALAFVADAYDCDSVAAEKLYLLALQEDPKSADAHHWYAWYLVQHQQFKQALKEIDTASHLAASEDVVATNLGRINYFSKSYLVALEYFDEALRLRPKFPKARLDRAMTYVEQNRLQDALADFVEAGLGLTEDGRDVKSRRAYAFARCGEKALARELLGEIEERSDTKSLAYDVAAIYAALEDRDQAFHWLQRAFRENSASRTYLRVDPRFDGIRADQRFTPFLDVLENGTGSRDVEEPRQDTAAERK